MIALIVLLSVAAAALGAWSASSTLATNAGTSRRGIRRMQDYEVADVREQEMLESVGARVIAPVVRSLTDFARRITPVGYTENVKRKIVLAGNPPGYEVDRFLIIKLLGL